MPFVRQTLLKNNAQHLLLMRHFECLLMLLDPKEDVQLQPPVMETDSRVDGGNYCMVYSATILNLLSSKLTTYIPLPGIYYLYFVASMKRQVHQRL